MKWQALRIYNYNLLAHEVEFSNTQQLSLLEDIKKGQINKLSKLAGFQKDLADRILEIDSFIENNSYDCRIKNFVNASNRLKNILNLCNIEEFRINLNNSETQQKENLTSEFLDDNINISKYKRNIESDSKQNNDLYKDKKVSNKFSTNAITEKKNESNELNQKISCVNNIKTNSKDNFSFNSWKEILFKIKLNKDEYNLLVKERENRNKT